MTDRSSLTTPTPGLVWLDEVSCDGTEMSLLDCNRNAILDVDCTSHELAACVCFGFIGSIGERAFSAENINYYSCCSIIFEVARPKFMQSLVLLIGG